jgi:hypothetical protein
MGLIRKVCNHPGCNNLQIASTSNYRGEPGVKMYRKWCQTHYDIKKANNAGFDTITEYQKDRAEAIAAREGFESVTERAKAIAAREGFESVTERKNSTHKYLKYRKTYCENIDGRYGSPCTTTIVGNFILDVDHIDGNSDNNDPSNLQTLCACCHRVKTKLFEDWKTPGRKALALAKKQNQNNTTIINIGVQNVYQTI